MMSPKLDDRIFLIKPLGNPGTRFDFLRYRLLPHSFQHKIKPLFSYNLYIIDKDYFKTM